MREVAGLASWLTPTRDRPERLPKAYAVFKSQTYEPKNWVVLDESAEPSAFMLALGDPRVTYVHDPQPKGDVTHIGRARNRLVAMACGEIVAHGDDDDHYSPEYLSDMVARLRARKCDAVKLSAWRIYDEKSGTVFLWDTTIASGPMFALSGTVAAIPVDLKPGEMDPGQADVNLYGYGFSLVARRSLLLEVPFPESGTEDIFWVHKLRELGMSDRLKLVDDLAHRVLHACGAHSASSYFPTSRIGPLTVDMLGSPARTASLRREVERCILGSVASMQELPQGKPIQIVPGQTYSVVASVKESHGMPSLVARMGSWGLDVEVAQDRVSPATYGVTPPPSGYRLVHVQAKSTKAQRMPWSTPKLVQVLGDRSTVVRAWTDAGDGMTTPTLSSPAHYASGRPMMGKKAAMKRARADADRAKKKLAVTMPAHAHLADRTTLGAPTPHKCTAKSAQQIALQIPPVGAWRYQFSLEPGSALQAGLVTKVFDVMTPMGKKSIPALVSLDGMTMYLKCPYTSEIFIFARAANAHAGGGGGGGNARPPGGGSGAGNVRPPGGSSNAPKPPGGPPTNRPPPSGTPMPDHVVSPPVNGQGGSGTPMPNQTSQPQPNGTSPTQPQQNSTSSPFSNNVAAPPGRHPVPVQRNPSPPARPPQGGRGHAVQPPHRGGTPVARAGGGSRMKLGRTPSGRPTYVSELETKKV